MSLASETPFWKNIREVATGFTNKTYLTLLAKDEEGEVVGYIHGYFITPTEFLLAQAYHPHSNMNEVGYRMIEEEARRLGCEKLLMLTSLNPQVFTKYGLGFERYLLTKYFND